MDHQHITVVPTKSPWWVEYRQKKKLRGSMTIEMIIRRSFREVLREYINNCSISGVQEICDSNLSWIRRYGGIVIRMGRIGLFSALVCLLWYLLYQTYVNTLAKPLIVSTESTTYPIGEIDFPAVALCNINRISKKAMKKFTVNLHDRLAFKNETIEEFEKFVVESGRLLDFSYDENLGKGNRFLDLIASEKYDSKKTVDAMKELAPNCSEMLVRCSWAGHVVSCDSVFAVRRTARGHCCAFNYILDYDSAQSPNNTIGEAKRQRLPGFLQGLSVVLDPMLDDYAYPINTFKGFEVLLYDPTHFADLSAGQIIQRMAEPNQAEFLEIRSIKQIASPEIRKYPVKIRKCLFKDEQVEEFNHMYSYSACIVSCRIKAIQSLCKCTPYFLPAGGDGSICSMEDLKCLNKYKEKLMYLYPMDAEKVEGLELEREDSLYCPKCEPDCELTQHFTKSFKTSTKSLAGKAYYVDDFILGINMSNKCILSIYHRDADGFLDKLDVVAYWFEVLSNIGGFAGVILGLSVFSAVEIVYFLLVRFIAVLRHNYKKYH